MAYATRIIVERGVGGLRIRGIFEQADASMSPTGATLDLDRTPKEQLRLAREEILARGLSGFLAASGEYLIQHFARNPDSLRLIRAVLSARFHDESARRAYEEVFRKDMVRALLTVCHLAAELGMLKESIRPQALAELLVAGYEHAIGDCFFDNGLDRFSAAVRDMLGVIGTMASEYSPLPTRAAAGRSPRGVIGLVARRTASGPPR